MNVPTIHVHSQSDKGTIGYVTFMWETMRSLANHPEALKLSLHCIGPTATERLKSLTNCRTYYVPNAEPDKGMSGSTAHAACVEHALQMTDDGDIHIIMDADTVVMAKGWDDYVRCELLDKGVGTLGATYEAVGGFSSGNGNVQTYKNVPNVVWMALSPKHRWRDLKAMPKKGDDIHITNEGMSKIYGLPVGCHVLRDVGWQIPEYLSNRGITYEGWKQLKPSKDATVLKGLSDYHEEYQVTADNVPFVVHHRGSMRHNYRGDKISTSFYAAVDAWLAQEKSRPPRWLWEPNEQNQNVLVAMQATKEMEAGRIAELEKQAGVSPLSSPTPLPPVVATLATGDKVTSSAVPGATLDGWLKATMDGVGVWSRYTAPVPQTINIEFTPDASTKNMRLEGTVSNVCLALPAAPNRPYTMTVRNLTNGPATLRVAGCTLQALIPPATCWFVVVDVDGVIHAE